MKVARTADVRPGRDEREIVNPVSGERIVIRTIEATPETRLVRTLTDEVAPVTARFELDISDSGGGARVRLVEKMTIAAVGVRGPYFRFAMLLGAGAGSRAYLDSLRQRLASGG